MLSPLTLRQVTFLKIYEMKQRILKGWTVRRVLYLAIGIWVIIYAIMVKEWWGAFLGAYFAAMGLFSFGCASGSCSVDYNRKQNPDKRSARADHARLGQGAME